MAGQTSDQVQALHSSMWERLSPEASFRPILGADACIRIGMCRVDRPEKQQGVRAVLLRGYDASHPEAWAGSQDRVATHTRAYPGWSLGSAPLRQPGMLQPRASVSGRRTAECNRRDRARTLSRKGNPRSEDRGGQTSALWRALFGCGGFVWCDRERTTEVEPVYQELREGHRTENPVARTATSAPPTSLSPVTITQAVTGSLWTILPKP